MMDESLLNDYLVYEFDQFFPNLTVFSDIIHKYQFSLDDLKDYRLVREEIVNKIKKFWDNEDYNWLINYMDNNLINIVSFDTKRIFINETLKQLSRWGIKIDEYSLEILLEKSAILKETLDLLLSSGEDFTNSLLADLIDTYSDLSGLNISDDEITSYQEYRDDLYGYLTMSNNEALDIFKKIEVLKKKGQTDEVKSLQNKIVEGNLHLVLKMVKNNFKMDSDLIQEGNVGLIKAVENFDYKKNKDFIKYAKRYIYWWIDKAIFGSQRIRYPMDLKYELTKIFYWLDFFKKEGKYTPTLEELEEYTSISKERLAYLLGITHDYCSWEELWENEDFSDDNREVIATDSRLIVNDALNILSLKHRKFVELNMGVNQSDIYSNREIAQMMGTSKAYANAVVLRSIKKIRRFLGVDGSNRVKFWQCFDEEEWGYVEDVFQKLDDNKKEILWHRFGKDLQGLNDDLEIAEIKKAYVIVQEMKTIIRKKIYKGDNYALLR